MQALPIVISQRVLKKLAKSSECVILFMGVSESWAKMRITANLISTERENSIWSSNFDLSIDEVLMLYKIAEQIVATIVGRVEEDTLNALTAKRPENMDAYDLVQGLEYAKKGNIVEANIEKAVELFEQAITSEPTYARAHAWRACSLET